MKNLFQVKRITLLAILLFCLPVVFAQKDEVKMSKKEKIERLKIGFITNELDLTKEQSEKFWPVYNEMSTKLSTERKTQRKLVKEMKDNYESLSESDCKTKSTAIFSSEIREAELKQKYNDQIAGIIGYKKAAKLLSLEQRFKRELLGKIDKRNPGKNPPPPPPKQ